MRKGEDIMFDDLIKGFTSNYKEVPLMQLLFNLEHYKEHGKEGSCKVVFHPELSGDKELQHKLGDLIDYIRDNYDMESLVK